MRFMSLLLFIFIISISLGAVLASFCGCSPQAMSSLCKSTNIMRMGHEVAGATALIVCASLEGDARKNCEKWAKRSKVAGDALLSIAQKEGAPCPIGE